MTIFFYKGLTRNRKSEIHPYEFSPISDDWGKLGIPNLANLVTTFTVSELLKKNQQGGGVKNTQIRVKKSSHEEVLPRESIFQKTHRLLLKKLQKTKKLLQQTLQKREKNFFNKLNASLVSDNRLFWKTVKRFFSNKGSHRSNIKLVEGDKLLQFSPISDDWGKLGIPNLANLVTTFTVSELLKKNQQGGGGRKKYPDQG